jgi:hypothetical protein
MRCDQRRSGLSGFTQRTVEPAVDRDEAAEPDRQRMTCATRVGILDRQLEPRDYEDAV